ncbi:MAG: hypothetical protein A2Y62_05035 [Candidatus Fischerbacteria bacterium RBG_13_37_8]|uniref:Tetratricopeptide repeat protein n=1 Tax=Candidatus Fischerbacteria bacterium RBG_13_37_8 TaxID=1817863 RepID=A0A1F5V8H8_9BACT|nr:MAG: hypothetical protein A2Y62_05035 [Candidatus Fischerbacteria bacterium RBG_13_37_8]
MKRIIFITTVLLLAMYVFTVAGDKSDAELQIELGIKAAKNNQWQEAAYRWKKATELESNNAAAHNNLAVAYEELGFFDAALEEYEIAYKLAPDNLSIKANITSFKESYKLK